MTSTIHHQVRLPVSVAWEVVLQGVRIRLGRSVVTLLGVALGIAFLMTILTGQLVRSGVSEETATRAELSRMTSILAAECGDLRDRDAAVVAVGPLNDLEKRFLGRLSEAGVAHFNVAGNGRPLDGVLPAVQGRMRTVPSADLAAGVVAVLVMGDGRLEPGDWDGAMDRARQSVVALTRRTQGVAPAGAVRKVSLDREMRPEELRELEETGRRERFRTVWITVIALLVTVIGISNAMLMSVTERFREIGTMKCLGALSAFIRRIFFLEAALMGVVGSAAGALLGFLFSAGAFMSIYGVSLVLSALSPPAVLVCLFGSLSAGVLLSVIAAIYPATFAARMLPANALRSTI